VPGSHGALPAVASEKPSCPWLLSYYVSQTIPNLTKNHPWTVTKFLILRICW